MNSQLDHIAVAVPDIDAAIETWQHLTHARVMHREHVIEQGAFVAFIEIGNLRIEFIAPDSPDSIVGKFLEKHGAGLHHIALRVPDGQSALDNLAERGAVLINKILRDGAENTRIGFVHPRSLDGVLLEIVEHSPKKGT